jgi:hypothetical protein
MNETQKEAMAIFEARNAGALLTRRGWIWKQDVRDDAAAAQAVLDMEAQS